MSDEIDWSKITKPCSLCGGTLVVRQQHLRPDVRFMGCSNWPYTGCPGRASIPAYAFQIARGATPLPGFDQ